MVIASNCMSVASFLLSGNAPNFFRSSARHRFAQARVCGRAVAITTTSPWFSILT